MDVENRKPFLVPQASILLTTSCSCRSTNIVVCDEHQIAKSSTKRDRPIEGGREASTSLIMMAKSATLITLSCRTPSTSSNRRDCVCSANKKRAATQKLLYKLPHIASNATAVKFGHYSVTPCGVACLFSVQKYGSDMVTTRETLTNACVDYQMVNRRVTPAKAALNWFKQSTAFYEPPQSTAHHFSKTFLRQEVREIGR